MEPTFFRSDETSFTDRIYHRPAELISFADLLLRWPSLGFFTIPFFTILRKKNDIYGFYLHVYEAKSIGIQKSPAAPKQSDAEALMIQLALHPPYTFRLRYEHLFLNFDILYFLRSEVEALEQAHPECTITNDALSKRNPLYETTRKNIRHVAALTLNRMASSANTAEEYRTTFTDGFIDPEHHQWWSDTFEEQTSSPMIFSDELPKEYLWGTLPAPLPKERKHGKNNDLNPIREVIKTLRSMGIREEKKSAKIIYHLYPRLTQEEIGSLYPAKSGKERTSKSDRDRGRVLLGFKADKKPPAKKGKPTADEQKPTT